MKKYSAESGRELYKSFKMVYNLQGMETFDDEPSYSSKKFARQLLMPMITAGQKLSKFILQNKSVPQGSKKDMEMAARAFMKVRRAPTKPKAWVQKKKKRIEFILTTERFPEKALGSDELFEVGPFKVHNTVGAEGKELEMIKDLIQKSHKAIRKSNIPKARNVLYGKVFLTGQLLRSNTMAWYDPNNDTISLRIRKKIDANAVHSLTHEFGHRLWNNHLDKDKKRQWARYHRNLGYSNDMPMPDVGDPLGFELKGMKEPVILKIEGDKFYVSEDGYLTYKQIKDAYTQEFSYPTRYSATNEEEHFCEALAMYCLGVLGKDHEEAFSKYIIRGEEYSR